MLKKTKSLSLILGWVVFIAAAGSVSAQESAAVPQEEYIITLPKGTILPIILTAYLNTKNSQAGDIVYASTNYPIWSQQKLVIPKGSEIRGTLTEVVRPGRIRGKGRLVIRFDDILLPNGVKRDLSASLRGIHGPGEERIDRDSESVDAGTSKGEDTETIIVDTGQGAVTGTMIGAIGGNTGKGAAIGAGVGAAAGLATVLLTRGKDLVLEPGTQFDLELQKPLEFSYYELEFNRSELDDARQSVRPAQPARPPQESGRNTGRSWPLPRIGLPF